MTTRKLRLSPAARADLHDILTLINDNEGADRADKALALIETFIRSLVEFPNVGSKLARRNGLRTHPVPKLRKATIVFEVTAEAVIIHRISYLGRNYWSDIPIFTVDDPIDLSDE